MSSSGAANARAEASRINGARSRGPKTPAGKLRASQNALRHGLRADRFVLLPDEDAGEFAALGAALWDELAPHGALQEILAHRIAVAAWRLARADRIEVELFEQHRGRDGGLAQALIRDGNGARAFDTLLRYRAVVLAELWRALRALKALQHEAGQERPLPEAVGAALVAGTGRPALPSAMAEMPSGRIRHEPNEPEIQASRAFGGIARSLASSP